jgi:RNA polymerase sigma-70 factor (ECF subfamily)
MLYEQSFNVLMSAAVRYKNNDEDRMTIVNNSFLKVIQKIDQFKVGTAYFSWVKRIVQNEIIDDFRRNKKYETLFDFEKDESLTEEEVHAEVDFETEENALLEMLNVLPPATKMVFNLYAIDGYTSKEICEKLNISYETVKWHIKEARKKLKLLLIAQQEKIVN